MHSLKNGFLGYLWDHLDKSCHEKCLCLLVHQVCTLATFYMIQTEQNFWYVVILQKKNRVNKLFNVLHFFYSFFRTESLSSFKWVWNHNLIISFPRFYCLNRWGKKRNSKCSSLQQMTPAGVFRGSLAAGELLCSFLIPCRAILPEALVLAGFCSWDLLVSRFFSVYPYNPDMDFVTAETIKDQYCAANQDSMEMFDVYETESIKQF